MSDQTSFSQDIHASYAPNLLQQAEYLAGALEGKYDVHHINDKVYIAPLDNDWSDDKIAKEGKEYTPGFIAGMVHGALPTAFGIGAGALATPEAPIAGTALGVGAGASLGEGANQWIANKVLGYSPSGYEMGRDITIQGGLGFASPYLAKGAQAVYKPLIKPWAEPLAEGAWNMAKKVAEPVTEALDVAGHAVAKQYPSFSGLMKRGLEAGKDVLNVGKIEMPLGRTTSGEPNMVNPMDSKRVLGTPITNARAAAQGQVPKSSVVDALNQTKEESAYRMLTEDERNQFHAFDLIQREADRGKLAQTVAEKTGLADEGIQKLKEQLAPYWSPEKLTDENIKSLLQSVRGKTQGGIKPSAFLSLEQTQALDKSLEPYIGRLMGGGTTPTIQSLMGMGSQAGRKAISSLPEGAQDSFGQLSQQLTDLGRIIKNPPLESRLRVSVGQQIPMSVAEMLKGRLNK